MRIPFGTIRGVEVFQHTITNGVMEAEILTFGATLRSLRVPDKNGKLIDVVLGFDSVEEYDQSPTFFGATVGRVANRIEKGRFMLNGKEYQVGLNDGNNSLHGGIYGFHRHVWKVAKETQNSLTLSLISPDGDEGYPGTLKVSVTYTLTKDNALQLEYEAVCDQDTPINLTNHSFFNLNGEGTILGHELQLNATRITPVDEEHIAHNEFLNVKGTPFDFTTPKPIGQDIQNAHIQMKYARGYDINFACDNDGFRCIGNLYASKSGINMQIYTDQPGVQLYTGNYLNNDKGKQNVYYPQYAGLCLETQNYPNAINCDAFPSMILSINKPFKTKTSYFFCAK